MDRLQNIVEEILRFRDERNWSQFHTPKNLSAALSIEVGELQELMLWKTDAEIAKALGTLDGKRRFAAEIADVLIYALLFCKATGVEPIDAMISKLKENADKYPVELSRGNSTKYSQLKKHSEKKRGS